MSETEFLLHGDNPDKASGEIPRINSVKNLWGNIIFVVVLAGFAGYHVSTVGYHKSLAFLSGDYVENSQLDIDITSQKENTRIVSDDQDDTSQDVVPKAVFRLFKRTHFSSGADTDAAFLIRNFGLKAIHNYTYNNYVKETFTWECAKRLELDTSEGGLNFAIHIFESFVTPTGPISTKDWVNYFVQMNYDSLKEHSWNAFMALSTTFYTTDLSPYYEHLTSNKVHMMRTRYMNPVDNAVMFSISVVIPHTGHLIEVVSDKLEKKYSVYFKQWPKGCCRQATEIGFSASELRSKWIKMGGVNSGLFQLPSLMPVKLSFPLASIDKFVSFFQTFDADLPVTVNTGSDVNGVNCTYATARVKTGEKDSLARYDVDIRGVDSPAAFVRNYSVHDWASYVNSIHDKFTGTLEKGWDRYLDNHFGLMLETDQPLDSYFGFLNTTGIDYRAHVGHVGLNQGSVWTGGIEGQGVEFHGNFTSQFAATLEEIDYCSPDSETRDVNPTAAPFPKPTHSYHPSNPPYPKPTKAHVTRAPTNPPYPKPTKAHVTRAPTNPPYPKPTKRHKTYVPSSPPYPKPTKEHKTHMPTNPPYPKPTKTHEPSPAPFPKPTKPHTHRPSNPPHAAPTKARESSSETLDPDGSKSSHSKSANSKSSKALGSGSMTAPNPEDQDLVPSVAPTTEDDNSHKDHKHKRSHRTKDPSNIPAFPSDD